jgi:hypothetical protein
VRPNSPAPVSDDSRSSAPRPGRRLTAASSGASGLLAGGLALLALAAVPVSGVVTEAFAEGEDPADEGVESTDDTVTRPAARTIAGAANDRDLRAEHLEVVVVAAASDEDAVEPAPEPEEPEPEPATEDVPDEPAEGPTKWDRLADCEAGDWDANGQPIPGTARWDYGIDFAHEGYEQFQGGLNFHPGTWDAFRDPDMPDHAGNATREQEIVVGERVLAAQGWGAWPVCSEMIGLR